MRIAERLREDGDCLVYTGRLRDGYGFIKVGSRADGTRREVHVARYVYELYSGPLPPGYVPDHTCPNRACCNPEHLEPVTNRENQLRGVARRAHRPKGQKYLGLRHRTRRTH